MSMLYIVDVLRKLVFLWCFANEYRKITLIIKSKNTIIVAILYGYYSHIMVPTNNMIKLSIIIPAYNVANWIDDCICSCMNQDMNLG